MNLQIYFTSNINELNAKLDKAIETLQFSGINGQINVSLNLYSPDEKTFSGGKTLLKAATIQEPVTYDDETGKNVSVTEKSKKNKAKKQEIVEEAINTVTYSRNDITIAAQKLSESKNTNVLRSVLGQFKSANGQPCKRLSDIQDEEISLWVKACDEAAL